MSTSPGQTMRTLFAMRSQGAPVPFDDPPTVQLVHANSSPGAFAVLDDETGTVFVAPSNAPNYEYLISWAVPGPGDAGELAPGDLLFFRITGNVGGIEQRFIAEETLSSDAAQLLEVRNLQAVACP